MLSRGAHGTHESGHTAVSRSQASGLMDLQEAPAFCIVMAVAAVTAEMLHGLLLWVRLPSRAAVLLTGGSAGCLSP